MLYNFGSKSGKIKVAFIYAIEGETLIAFVDENDYLYELGDDNVYKKTIDSKVVMIDMHDDKCDITFSSGDSRRLSDVDAYK